jgi:hypothetical protein
VGSDVVDRPFENQRERPKAAGVNASGLWCFEFQRRPDAYVSVILRVTILLISELRHHLRGKPLYAFVINFARRCEHEMFDPGVA